MHASHIFHIPHSLQFSILLSYPDLKLKNNIDNVYKIIQTESMLSTDNIIKLTNLIDFIKNNKLTYLQEYYVSVFDRKKDFSLSARYKWL